MKSMDSEEGEVMTLVHIEEQQHSQGREYVISDKNRIQFARFFILEADKKRKHVLLRLRFQRMADDEEMTELLTKIYSAFTKRGDYFKISIITSDDINVRPFSRLGFMLEGVLQDHVYRDAEIRDEYVFGVTALRFRLVRQPKLLEVPGERICLKLVGPEDAQLYLDYYRKNKEFLADFEPYKEDSFFTPEGQKQELTERYLQYLNGNTINFGIFQGMELIGKIRLSNIIPGSFKCATIGYALSHDRQNQGFMSEAVGLICQYAFTEMGLHRLEASTLLDNVRSQHVLLNNGFELLGLNPKYLQINGKWQDHYTYYLLRENWEKLCPANAELNARQR